MEILRWRAWTGRVDPMGRNIFYPSTFTTWARLMRSVALMRASHCLFVGNVSNDGGMIALGLSGALRARDLRSIGCSALQASPADVSRHTDQTEAQMFPDKHHRPSARLHRALIWSDSSWASQRAVPRLDDVFSTSVTWRQVRPQWRWWWMSVLPFLLIYAHTARCSFHGLAFCLTVRRVLFLTCFYITRK